MEKKIILQNKKLFYEYYVEDKLECGIQLYGNEIKDASLDSCDFANLTLIELFMVDPPHNWYCIGSVSP